MLPRVQNANVNQHRAHSWGSMPPDLPKTLGECSTVPNYTETSLFFMRIPTRLESGHGEYPNFEDQLSQLANKYIFLNNHILNICYKMNKLFNLDIQVNSELQSC